MGEKQELAVKDERNNGISLKSDETLKAQARKISIKEGSAFSLSDGFGLRYITPYALAVGANNLHIGLLSSIPSLLSNLMQVYTSRLMEKYSRKKIVVVSVFLQAFMWLALLSVGVMYFIFGLRNFSPWALIGVYTLLAIFGASGGPAWNSWMKDIVTEERGKYFSKRNRICGAIALTCMLIGGFILDYFKNTHVFIGFVILFVLSFIGRSVSGYLFTRKYEPSLKLEKEYYFSFWQFLKRMPQSNYGKFVLFIALINLTSAIASPFFSVYVLKNLGFSYTEWIITVVVNSLASLLLMPLWGKFSDKYGNVKTMRIAGVFIAAVPALYLLTVLLSLHNFIFAFLIFTEIISGFIWAGFNLASGNFTYDAVSRERIALCTAYAGLMNGLGVFIGASIGGLIASFDFVFIGWGTLLVVFLVSAIARVTVYLVMINRIKEVREVKKFDIPSTKKFWSFIPGKIESLSQMILKPRPTDI